MTKTILLATAFGVALATTNFASPFSAVAAPARAVLTTTVAPAQVKFGSIKVDGLNIAYREAGDPKLPKLVLLHGWPSSSHQYRDLIPALSQRFHVIAPDYQGFGNSDRPDPATYHYSFDAISVTIEKFLAAKGFDHYGLFMQDYGGPVGFRIVGRNPKALDWLIIQNTNAYEVGFSAAWDGFRKALWMNRTRRERGAARRLQHARGHQEHRLSGRRRSSRADRARRASRPTRRPSRGPTTCASSSTSSTTTGPTRRSIPAWQKFLREQPAQDADLLGPARPLLHPGGRRSLSAGPAQGRDAPAQCRPFRDRGQSSLHRRPHHQLLRRAREGEVADPTIALFASACIAEPRANPNAPSTSRSVQPRSGAQCQSLSPRSSRTAGWWSACRSGPAGRWRPPGRSPACRARRRRWARLVEGRM